MEPKPENRLMVANAGEAAPETALAAPAGQALAGAREREPAHDQLLGQLGMRLDVMVKVPAFCVRDLLALETGTVLETGHEHGQDMPVRCGGALLAWAEFEVVNEGLAVRLTRLA